MLLDYLKTSSPLVEESAHLLLRYSHPFLLQQLSQISPRAVFFELVIDIPLLLVPKILNWVEIWQVWRTHHSLSEETMLN